MKNKLIKKITAAAMAFSFAGAAVSAPVDKNILSGSIFTAFAETSTATFDESTGVLTLHGNVVKEDVQKWIENYYVKRVSCEEGTVLPVDSSGMFYRFRADSIDLRNTDTSKVTDMSHMFDGCSVEYLDLSSFDTSNVTDMSHMFDGCNAESLELSNFDTSNVTDMSYLFNGCNAKSLELSNFDTSNVTDMSYMFACCFYLESLDLCNFDTLNVTDMSDMFRACENLEFIELSSFDTGNVYDMSYMFYGCNAESLDLRSFDTSSVEHMDNMFSSCSELETIYVSNLWSTFNVYSNNMFSYCNKLVGGAGTVYDYNHIDINYAQIDGGADNPGYFTLSEKYDYESYLDEETGTLHLKGNVKNSFGGAGVFLPIGADREAVKNIVAEEGTVLPANCNNFSYGLSNLRSVDLKNADTSNVTDMCYMFCNCESLESLNLSSFDTSNVTDMGGMFCNCESLESLNLSSFDTSNVTYMGGMFCNCKNLKSLDLSNFDTSNVTNMSSMFRFCEKLEYLDVTSFDTSNLNYDQVNCMIQECTALEPSICVFNGYSVTLDGNIGVNMYIQPCENLAKIVMSGPNGDRTFTDFTGITQESGDYKFTYPVNATQGNEKITIKAYDNDGKRLLMCEDIAYVCEFYYGLCNHSQVECTVYGYIDQFNKHSWYWDSFELIDVVDALENYCKAAENYFKGTDNTIAGIENVTADSVSEYATDLSSKIKLSLVLNSTTALRIYTDSDNVFIDGEAVKAKYKDDKKYYDISNICAQQLCSVHKISIDGTEYSCSALSYVNRVLNNPNVKDNKLLTDMTKATYVYAKAVEAYVNYVLNNPKNETNMHLAHMAQQEY